MTTAPTTDERPICPGCKNPIDPEVCWCGDYMKNHGAGTEHPAVPMGCDCLRDKSTTDERDDWDAFVAERPSQANPFTSAKICGVGVSLETYKRQPPRVKRGDPEYVMSRGELAQFSICPARWRNGYREGESESKEWGALLDCIALDRENLTERYAVCPMTYPDTKTGKPKKWNRNATFCEKWEEQQGDREIIKQWDMDAALGIRW